MGTGIVVVIVAGAALVESGAFAEQMLTLLVGSTIVNVIGGSLVWEAAPCRVTTQ